MPPAGRPIDRTGTAAAADLGAYRPVSAEASSSTRQAETKGAAHRDVGLKRISGVEGVVGPIPPGAQRALLGRRHTLLAASFLGAIVFAASTGFGQHVRHVEALSGEIDRLLVASGFGINEISLTGHHHTSDQDIFRALDAGHATLLTLDVDAARRRVETLPWIETATLVRIFPDKLRVELRERKPSAIWHDGDRTALVDAEGRLLGYVAPSHLPSGLPHVAGAGAPAAAAELWASLARFPSVAGRMQLARRIGDRRWDIELSNGARVKLAAGDPAASLDRLMRLERQARSLDHAGQVIDLTVPRAIAISTSASGRGVPRAQTREPPVRPL
jgi:cell division protein FtsQ